MIEETSVAHGCWVYVVYVDFTISSSLGTSFSLQLLPILHCPGKTEACIRQGQWLSCTLPAVTGWDAMNVVTSFGTLKEIFLPQQTGKINVQNMICNMHHVFTISSGLILAFLRYPDQIGKTKKGSYPFGVEEPNLRWSTIAFRNVHDHMMHWYIQDTVWRHDSMENWNTLDLLYS